MNIYDLDLDIQMIKWWVWPATHKHQWMDLCKIYNSTFKAMDSIYLFIYSFIYALHPLILHLTYSISRKHKRVFVFDIRSLTGWDLPSG